MRGNSPLVDRKDDERRVTHESYLGALIRGDTNHV
jgi:hypothetical protein